MIPTIIYYDSDYALVVVEVLVINISIIIILLLTLICILKMLHCINKKCYIV